MCRKTQRKMTHTGSLSFGQMTHKTGTLRPWRCCLCLEERERLTPEQTVIQDEENITDY